MIKHISKGTLVFMLLSANVSCGDREGQQRDWEVRCQRREPRDGAKAFLHLWLPPLPMGAGRAGERQQPQHCPSSSAFPAAPRGPHPCRASTKVQPGTSSGALAGPTELLQLGAATQEQGLCVHCENQFYIPNKKWVPSGMGQSSFSVPAHTTSAPAPAGPGQQAGIAGLG